MSLATTPRLRSIVALAAATGLLLALPGAALAADGEDLDTALGTSNHGPWVAALFAVAFLAPFVDVRRPFRLLHLDLVVLVGFGVSHVFFNRGELDRSVPLAYAVLVYVLVRMLVAGFRPRGQSGPLVPIVGPRLLAVGLAVLVAIRIGLAVTSPVTDVGEASVVGADRVTHGETLYRGFPLIADNLDHGDAYPPFLYLAYVPFELVLPWHGPGSDLGAAYAAAIAFDLLIVLTLVLVGRRLRSGGEGRVLGLALGYAWVAYPYSLYALDLKTNDGLLALLMLVAFLLTVARAPAASGAATALGTAAKGVTLVLAPLFASALRPRGAVRYLVTLAVVLLVVVLPFVVPVGVGRFYDRTLGFQADRETLFTPWGRHPELGWLVDLLRVCAVGLALLVAFRPRVKTPVQVAALAAAIVVAVELCSPFWYYPYVVWFAPLALVALFGEAVEPEARRDVAPVP
jgi:glycosyl transferase family 87